MNRCPISQEHEVTRCKVKTCKNYSPITENRCICIDRESTKSEKISDAEIQYLKNLNTRNMVLYYRKHAEERIMCLLVLDSFLEFCKKPTNFIDVARIEKNEAIIKLKNSFPFNTNLWSFPLMLMDQITDTRKFNRFKKTNINGKGNQYKLHKILGMKPEEFSLLRGVIRRAKNQD